MSKPASSFGHGLMVTLVLAAWFYAGYSYANGSTSLLSFLGKLSQAQNVLLAIWVLVCITLLLYLAQVIISSLKGTPKDPDA